MRPVLLAALGVSVAACHCGGSETTDAGIDAGLAYDELDAWREIRTVIRQSPDAVPARAEALIATQDAAGLFALVRDDIALWPTGPQGFDGAETEVRWGPRATLRGQAGTPRERAELLASLYARAGFTAEVVSGLPAASVTNTALLARPRQQTIPYASTDAQVARWAAALPRTASAPPVPTPLDADQSVRNAIIAQLDALQPADTATAFTAAYPGVVPLVKVTVGGAVKFANPNVDNAVFGESYTVDAPALAGEVSIVKVTLPNDLQSIYRTLHVGTGVDVPPIMGPGDAACAALLGG